MLKRSTLYLACCAVFVFARHMLNRDSSRSLLKSFCAIAVVIGLTIMCSPQDTYATTSSINLQVSNSSFSLNLVPSVNGHFTKSTSNTVNVVTNNYTGYTLKIQTATIDSNATKLVNEEAGTTMDSLSSAISEADFSSNNTESTAYNGKWGYQPSKYVTTINDATTVVDNTGEEPVFLPSPNPETGDILDITNVANPTIANNYTISLGARAGYETTPGTYSNDFRIMAIGNPIVYSISFADDTNDSTIDNFPVGTGSVATTDIDILLPSTVPTRTGYTFVGWCKGETEDANGNPSSTSTEYSKGTVCPFNTPYPASTAQDPSYYEIDQTADNTDMTFYATWRLNSYTQTTQIRYENADGTWGNYATAETKNVNYGTSYAWDTSKINNFDSTTYKAASVSSYTITEDHINYVSIYRNTFTCKINYKLQKADGTYDAVTNAINTTKRYGQACSWSRNADATYKAASYTNNNITANVNTTVNVDRNTFTVTKRYRLQGTDGNYPSSYTSGGTQTVLYGGSYTYSIAATTTHQAASKSASNITTATTISVDVPRKTVTCNRRYRLQAADGTYPSTYTSDGSVSAYYGGSCSYSKTVTDYNSNSAKSTSASNVTSTQTLSLDFPRNTYALTVNRNTTYISSVSGAGTYRWGQSISISASAASCQGFNGWTVSSGSSGTFANAANASTTYTMPKGASTIYANGKNVLPSTISGYIQDVGAASSYCAGASGTVTDRRDNQTYTVKKLGDGNLWMTRNLAIGCNGSGGTYGSGVSSKSLTSTYSNVSSTWSTPTALLSTAAYSTDVSGYTTAAMMCSSTYGAWYNYKAATAGTITGASNSTADTYNICPKNWTLPTSTQLSGMLSYKSDFSPVLGGYYDGGTQKGSFGDWWSVTSQSDTRRYYLGWAGEELYVNTGSRFLGLYVRCIRK